MDGAENQHGHNIGRFWARKEILNTFYHGITDFQRFFGHRWLDIFKIENLMDQNTQKSLSDAFWDRCTHTDPNLSSGSTKWWLRVIIDDKKYSRLERVGISIAFVLLRSVRTCPDNVRTCPDTMEDGDFRKCRICNTTGNFGVCVRGYLQL